MSSTDWLFEIGTSKSEQGKEPLSFPSTGVEPNAITRTTPGKVPKNRNDSKLSFSTCTDLSDDESEWDVEEAEVSGLATLLLDEFDHDRYPKRKDLPWHFSFIDEDMMVAGMSIPSEREHWKALKELEIKLVVNVTEQPVTPPSTNNLFRVCTKCNMVDEHYSPEVFDDITLEDEMSVLFLPIKDGSIPRWEQIEVFLDIISQAIEAKQKVAVHCQAGVGRTGTYLACFLLQQALERGSPISPKEAIEKLRRVRPQSMMFRISDWQTFPFLWEDVDKNMDSWQRNWLQERYVEVWWERRGGNIRPDKHSDCIEVVGEEQGMFPSASFLGMDALLVSLVDTELQNRLEQYSSVSQSHIEHDINRHDICFACKGLPVVGPFLINQRMSWPSGKRIPAHKDDEDVDSDVGSIFSSPGDPKVGFDTPPSETGWDA